MKTALATLFALALATPAFAQDDSAPTDSTERYTTIFNQLDKDGSKTLNKEEAEPSGLSTEGYSRLDANGDGELDLEEFLALANTGVDTQ